MRTLIILTILFFSTVVYGQPFLGCDPDPLAVEYIVEFDGEVLESQTPLEHREGVTLIMDLHDHLTQGVLHTVRMRAVNSWGDVSEWSSPLEFTLSGGGIAITRQQPNAPSVLRLISE